MVRWLKKLRLPRFGGPKENQTSRLTMAWLVGAFAAVGAVASQADKLYQFFDEYFGKDPSDLECSDVMARPIGGVRYRACTFSGRGTFDINAEVVYLKLDQKTPIANTACAELDIEDNLDFCAQTGDQPISGNAGGLFASCLGRKFPSGTHKITVSTGRSENPNRGVDVEQIARLDFIDVKVVRGRYSTDRPPPPISPGCRVSTDKAPSQPASRTNAGSGHPAK